MKRLILIISATLALTLTCAAKNKDLTFDSYAMLQLMSAYKDNDTEKMSEWARCELSERPKNAYALAMYAFALQQDGFSSMALDRAENALKYLPKDDVEYRYIALNVMGLALNDLERYQDALDALTAAVNLAPDSGPAFWFRSHQYLTAGNTEAAVADLMKVVEFSPAFGEPYNLLIDIANQNQKWNDALRWADKAASNVEDGSDFLLSKASAYINLGQIDDAVDQIVSYIDTIGSVPVDKIIELPEDVRTGRLMQIVVSRGEQDPTAYKWQAARAKIHHLALDYDSAIAAYRKALTRSIDDFYSPEIIADIFNNLTRCYLGKGDLHTALEYCGMALSVYPDPTLLNIEADILSALNRFDEAIAVRNGLYGSSATVEDYDDLINYANDLMSTKRYDRAAFAYNHVLENFPAVMLDPSVNYCFLRRGDAYRLSGFPEDAEKDYLQVIALEKGAPLSANSFSPLAYAHLGNNEKALESAKQILDNELFEPELAHYNAACVYATLGQKDLAVKHLENAIRLGYDRYEWILVDYDLDSLHDYQPFIDLVIDRK